MIRKGDEVKIRKEWQDPGDEHFVWLALGDEDGGRVRIAPINTGLSILPNQVVLTSMVAIVSEDKDTGFNQAAGGRAL